MNTVLTELRWLDEHEALSLEQLAELSGLSAALLRELLDAEVIRPIDPQTEAFHARCVLIAQTARRLREDFELDTPGLVLAMTLMERVHELETELRHLGAQLPRLR